MTTHKTALVTGGGGGIGCATALAFAREGYRVLVADLSVAAAQATVAQVLEAGGDAAAYELDIGDSLSVSALFAALRTRGERLDVAFNNAGVGGNGKALADIDDEDWERSLNINVSGTWRCMREEIRWMLGSGGGRIVNNCSIFGLVGGANAAYTASKHAIAGMTRSAALSYAAQHIRVNGVCPGLIEAGMGLKVLERAGDRVRDIIALHPAGRAGSSEEVAAAVLWLCSDAASFVHGHLLSVDGGYVAR